MISIRYFGEVGEYGLLDIFRECLNIEYNFHDSFQSEKNVGSFFAMAVFFQTLCECHFEPAC